MFSLYQSLAQLLIHRYTLYSLKLHVAKLGEGKKELRLSLHQGVRLPKNEKNGELVLSNGQLV
jgi:hypothetical protein